MEKELEFEKKKLSEFEKKKFGKLYSKALVKLFLNGEISEPEMDNVVRDVEILKILFKESKFTKTKLQLDSVLTDNWLNLNYQKILNQKILEIFEKSIFPFLSSEFTKVWIEEQIKRNHFVVLGQSFKYFLRTILFVNIEVPEYINISDKHQEKIKSVMKYFYKHKINERSHLHHIKLNYKHIKTGSEFEGDKEYVKLANQLFDFLIQSKKNCLKFKIKDRNING